MSRQKQYKGNHDNITWYTNAYIHVIGFGQWKPWTGTREHEGRGSTVNMLPPHTNRIHGHRRVIFSHSLGFMLFFCFAPHLSLSSNTFNSPPATRSPSTTHRPCPTNPPQRLLPDSTPPLFSPRLRKVLDSMNLHSFHFTFASHHRRPFICSTFFYSTSGSCLGQREQWSHKMSILIDCFPQQKKRATCVS